MADTDLPGRRTATREGWEATAPARVSAEGFTVVVDCTDFVMTLSPQGAQALAQHLCAAAAVANKARKDHEPPTKEPWIP